MANISHLNIRPQGLPVEKVFGDLQLALSENPCAVLQAPPGAGKTTCVPLALLNAPWLGDRKIIMLAPRRLAARAAAARMADLVSEKVGRTVGYRVRMDSRVSADTRIEVVTEGVLTRMLQGDPALQDTGLVIFDEYHERNLDADLGLALCLDMQGVLNRDLRLLIMSATIETGPVAAMLNHAPVITCSGRMFPVETRYVGRHTPTMSVDAVYRAVLTAVGDGSGSILVFLPGVREIRQLAGRLEDAPMGPEWIVAPIFGNLTRSAQDRAIAPPTGNRRKIVLATAIAETSLTIEGIRVVVDCGLQRVPRFDLRSGLTRLVTIPVSQSSADQRRGRAGRMGPGECLRLWSEQMHHTLPASRCPEILQADLAGLALELAIWGVDDVAKLKWLDAPSKSAFDNARGLLVSLGALNDDGRITGHGRRMAALPLHPRLAHMVIAADRIGQGPMACDLAALCGERDVLRFDPGRQDADMRIRYDLLGASRRGQRLACPGATVDHRAVRRVVRASDHLRRRLKGKTARGTAVSIGRLFAWAYPDRVAQRRPGLRGRFLLTGGRGAYLDATSTLAGEAYLVALELDGERRNARIFRAAACSLDILMEQFADQVKWVPSVDWDTKRRAVNAKRDLTLGALVLRSEPMAVPDARQVQAALLNGIARQGIECLPWTKALRRWQERVCFLKRFTEDRQSWPDVSNDGLEMHISRWLAPYLNGMTGMRDVSRMDLRAALFSMLSHEQHRRLDALAPTHFAAPSGSRIPIDYSSDVPVLAVRVQEMFGTTKTPSVAGGRQALLIHLLSPASRPVQITRDLAGFWQTGYPQVRKELKGRYPKHHWPEDPLKARATARVKRSG